jgi:hypothetical protein
MKIKVHILGHLFEWFVLVLCLALGFLTDSAQAQGRPKESDIFGSPQPTKAEVTKETATAIDSERENAIESKGDAFETGRVQDNPLQIGGTLYQRMIMSAQEGVDTADFPLSMPMQFDLFLDARPSDRIRGFIDQRLLYDSSKDAYSRSTAGTSFGSLTTAPTAPNNPQTVLDQAWLKFDIDHAVFVTVGKQHLKWGTARFWNPTDFLSTQIRDPLLPYDLRLGDSMAKFEIPVESKKTNLYAVGLFNNPGPASTVGQLGLALRAETVFGETEIGIDLVARGRRTPTYGADISSSLGPFDIYAESALLTTTLDPKYTLTGTPTTGVDVSTLYTSEVPNGPFVQTAVGANYSFEWTENRLATVGIEYFNNPLGYDSNGVYPLLIFFSQYKPFYLGQHYGAFYLTAEGLDSQKNTSYTFSTLSNISDKSLISRFDFKWTTLTYLSFEAFTAVHYGNDGGEFNFEINTPQMTYSSATIAAVNLPRTIYELGLGLRLAF